MTTPAAGQPANDRLNARETVSFAFGLAALYAAIVLVSDGQVLFTRPLWVDEVWMLLVSRAASPVDVIAGLSQGADGGAGLVHLGAWALQKVAGAPSPLLLRTIALACAFLTLCLVYVVLRRRFSTDASIAGAMAIGANYVFVVHSFEARFYGPWLLLCAVLAFAIGRHHTAPTRASAALVGVTALLMCTVHFYGIITLGIMLAGASASVIPSASEGSAPGKRNWHAGLQLVAPAIVGGIVGVLLILPLAIRLRGSLPSTWVPEFEARQIRALANQFWLSAIPLAAAGVLAAGILAGPRLTGARRAESVAGDAFRDPAIAALGALAIVPLAMVVLTLLGQPSMLFRYNIATVLAWAPFVAMALDVAGRWPARVARVLLVVAWFATFVHVRFEKIVFAGDVTEVEDALAVARAQRAPVVFASVHEWYPAWHRDTALRASTAFLEMSDATFARMFRPGTVNEMYNRGLVLDRSVVRVHARRFGVPGLVPEAVLDTTSRFVVVAGWARLPVGFRSIERFGHTVFPDHRVTMLDPNSALFEKAR